MGGLTEGSQARFSAIQTWVPILIHLLNRRSAVVVKWGAMRFLLASLSSRRRRVMFEEIVPRLRNPRLLAPPRFVRSFFVNAIKEMRIRFDGAAD